MNKILITGSGGFIGSTYMSLFRNKTYGVDKLLIDKFYVDEKLDLSNKNEILSLLSKNNFSGIIHIAAIKDLRECEANPELARKISIESTKLLSDYSFRNNIPLIFISSDQVFGNSKGPHKEDEKTDPLSVYAKIKEECENIVLSKGKTVVRLSLVLGLEVSNEQKDNDFLRNQSMFISYVMSRLKEDKEVLLEEDLYCSPINVYDVCQGLNILLEGNYGGIYHLAGPDKISRYDMAARIAKRMNKLNLVKRKRADHDKLRSKDASLDITYFNDLTSFSPKSFEFNVEKEYIYFKRKEALKNLFEEHLRDSYLIYYYGSLSSKKKFLLHSKTDIDLTVIVEDIIDFCINSKLEGAKSAIKYLKEDKVQYICLKGLINNIEYSIDLIDKKLFESRFSENLCKYSKNKLSYKWGKSPQRNQYKTFNFMRERRLVRKKCIDLEDGYAIGLDEFHIINGKYFYGIPTIKILTSTLYFEKEEGFYMRIMSNFIKILNKRLKKDFPNQKGASVKNLLIYRDLLNKETRNNIYNLEVKNE